MSKLTDQERIDTVDAILIQAQADSLITEIRLARFRDLRHSSWYSKIFSRLSATDIDIAELFILKNGSLHLDDFEAAVNRMFLDKADKPKRWKEISELIAVTNK